MKYNINNNIKTLKKAWNILKEIELDGLLTGGMVEIDLHKLIDNLLSTDKINEFCQTITGESINFEELELTEVVSLISSFFSDTIGKLKELRPNIISATPIVTTISPEPQTHFTE